MSGKDNAVLDSNFLIYLSKGKIDREKLGVEYERLFVSIITYIEVYAYEFVDPSERQKLDDVFENLEIVNIDASVAERCIEYRKQKSKRIKLPDAIILATALSMRADLITHNIKDFENVDSSVRIIDIEDFKI